MKKHILSFAAITSIVVLSGSFASCKTRKQNQEAETSTAIGSKVKALEVKPVLLDTANYGRDSFQANNVRVNGDTLFIEAEYSGGCKNHIFTARHNGNYMKSMPPQLNLYVDHQGNGDGCRELIRETIAFDLTNCKVGKSGNLILLINADRSKKVTYTY